MSTGEKQGCLSKKWVLIVLGLVGTLAVAIVVFVLAIVFLVFGVMKNSDVYRQALDRARFSPDVKAAIGEPIEEGWYVMGNIKTDNDSGSAEIRFPISGPKGSGTVEATATKRNGLWIYTRLGVQVDGGSWIDLPKGGP